MLIYNTTYQVDEEIVGHFLVWIKECYIPEVENQGLLREARLCQVLSHRGEEGYCYSLQFEVDDSETLHRWHIRQGAHLNEQLVKTFKNKVVGFPTLMEVVE